MHAENFYQGPMSVQRPGALPFTPTRQPWGYGPTGRTAILDVVPVAITVGGVAAAQTLAGAGPLVLAGASTGVTPGTDPGGNAGLQLDVQRAVSLTSAANESAVNFTLVGYDQYGRKVTSTIAGPNVNTVTFPKTVLWVESITASAAVASNVSAQTADVFGLPIVTIDAGYVDRVGWNNALAQDAGTFTAADQTSPPTASTGDVFGKYAPSSASNGTKRLVVEVLLSEANVGANANTASCYGVQA